MNGEAGPLDVRPLDVGPLHVELESFVREVEASPAIEDAAVLQRARLLLVRLRKRPAAADSDGGASEDLPEEVPDGAGGPDGWQAIRAGDGSRSLEVTCWKEGPGTEAFLHGEWEGEQLELAYVAVGERFWGTRQTPQGESRASTDAKSEGAADRRRFADIPRRAREEMESWNEATAVRRWVCGRCSWQNEEETARCPVCGTGRAELAGSGDGAGSGGAGGEPGSPAPRVPWPFGSDVGIPDDPDVGEPPRGRSSEVLELPDDWSDALEDLVRDVAEDVARDVAEELREHARRTESPQVPVEAGAGFDVVLAGFDPARKISCIQAVKDAREVSGETPSGLAAAKDLVERAPATVCRAVSGPGAEEIRKAIEQVGGRVEIRRSESDR